MKLTSMDNIRVVNGGYAVLKVAEDVRDKAGTAIILSPVKRELLPLMMDNGAVVVRNHNTSTITIKAGDEIAEAVRVKVVSEGSKKSE